MRKYIFLAVLLGSSIFVSAVALAEEDASEDAFVVSVAAEEEVSAAELGVSEPSAFSWFGSLVRDVRILVTRDPVKKSELELEKASEQLIKARKLAQDNPTDANLKTRLENLDNRYGQLVDKINDRIEKFKTENPAAPRLKNFLDKFTDQQIKHQGILKKLEEKLPEGVAAAIKEKREAHLEKFGEAMNRLQNKEELKERLGNILENQGEKIKNRVQSMEIVEELKQKAAPELKAKLNQLQVEKREVFNDLKEKRLEIKANNRTNAQPAN